MLVSCLLMRVALNSPLFWRVLVRISYMRWVSIQESEEEAAHKEGIEPAIAALPFSALCSSLLPPSSFFLPDSNSSVLLFIQGRHLGEADATQSHVQSLRARQSASSISLHSLSLASCREQPSPWASEDDDLDIALTQSRALSGTERSLTQS